MANRAFVIYHKSFEYLAVYATTAREKAIRAAYNAAREAGYTTVSWLDFSAKRASKYDHLADKPGTYVIGHHARAYDLGGNFTGYDQFGCLEGLRIHPRLAYQNINAEEPTP